jgi:hypothetical protein
MVGESRKAADHKGWLCGLVVLVFILLSYPISNQAYWDDFDSTMTALNFARTGHVMFNGWLAPTQGWEIVWGALFIKLFGFSFTVVRLSTLPLVMILMWVFYSYKWGLA